MSIVAALLLSPLHPQKRSTQQPMLPNKTILLEVTARWPVKFNIASNESKNLNDYKATN